MLEYHDENHPGLTNVHHIDFHNSYPAGLVNTHPEFKDVITFLYNKLVVENILKIFHEYIFI